MDWLGVATAAIGALALLIGLVSLTLAAQRRQWSCLRSGLTWLPMLLGLGVAISAIAHLDLWPNMVLQIIDLGNVGAAMGIGVVVLMQALRRSYERSNRPTEDRFEDTPGNAPRVSDKPSP